MKLDKRWLIGGGLLVAGFLWMRNASAGEAVPATSGAGAAGASSGGGGGLAAGLQSMLGALLAPQESPTSYPVSSPSVASAATATMPAFMTPAPAPAPAAYAAPAPAPLAPSVKPGTYELGTAYAQSLIAQGYGPAQGFNFYVDRMGENSA